MPNQQLHTEIDRIEKNDWDRLIAQFDDASIRQTWSYGSSPDRKKRASHIVLKAGKETLGCCQVALRCVPFFHNFGTADVQWGPLCMKKGEDFNSDALLHMLRGIKEEYSIKRGYFVRIWPQAKGDRKETWKQVLESEGFTRNPGPRPYRTFIVDLSPPLEALRKNFLQKWRNCLNKAEKNNLKVIEGTDDRLYSIFLKLLDQMVERKQFETYVNYKEYGRIQKDLPQHLKMYIMICESDGDPICALICSAIGDTGIYLLGATGHKGLNLNPSYLLQWRMMQWLKEKGFRYYDLGAFNPELNPGVFHFKQGIAGKQECDETFLGEYQGCFNLKGRIVKSILNVRKS